jgi:hypothetical protein
MDSAVRTNEKSRRKAVWGSGICYALLIVLFALTAAGCGDATRQGTSPAYLIITNLEAASGAEPDEFGNTVHSDVLTIVDDVPTIFSDVGRVSMVLAMRDPGTATQPTEPTSANFITVQRYRVRYIRADGRNTPGVDVPYGFDGSITMTVRTGEVSAGFEIVRHIAKQESPLAALVLNPTIISTIAEITFFGFDQTGREVSVTGRILIDFGNFGDPE